MYHRRFVVSSINFFAIAHKPGYSCLHCFERAFFFFFFCQVDDTEVISFLLSTEIIPLCLRTMEMGSELSKTVEYLEFIALEFTTWGHCKDT